MPVPNIQQELGNVNKYNTITNDEMTEINASELNNFSGETPIQTSKHTT